VKFWISFHPYHTSYFAHSTVYRQLVKTGEKKLEKKKSSIPVTGPVPSSSRKTMQPAPPDGQISPEGATLMQQANHEVDAEEVISEDDHIVESDEGEPDLLEDKMVLEEEELRKDHQGLDEPPTAMTSLNGSDPSLTSIV
jgi:hypothetical protein